MDFTLALEPLLTLAKAKSFALGPWLVYSIRDISMAGPTTETIPRRSSIPIRWNLRESWKVVCVRETLDKSYIRNQCWPPNLWPPLRMGLTARLFCWILTPPSLSFWADIPDTRAWKSSMWTVIGIANQSEPTEYKLYLPLLGYSTSTSSSPKVPLSWYHPPSAPLFPSHSSVSVFVRRRTRFCAYQQLRNNPASSILL